MLQVVILIFISTFSTKLFNMLKARWLILRDMIRDFLSFLSFLTEYFVEHFIDMITFKTLYKMSLNLSTWNITSIALNLTANFAVYITTILFLKFFVYNVGSKHMSTFLKVCVAILTCFFFFKAWATTFFILRLLISDPLSLWQYLIPQLVLLSLWMIFLKIRHAVDDLYLRIQSELIAKRLTVCFKIFKVLFFIVFIFFLLAAAMIMYVTSGNLYSAAFCIWAHVFLLIPFRVSLVLAQVAISLVIRFAKSNETSKGLLVSLFILVISALIVICSGFVIFLNYSGVVSDWHTKAARLFDDNQVLFEKCRCVRFIDGKVKSFLSTTDYFDWTRLYFINKSLEILIPVLTMMTLLVTFLIILLFINTVFEKRLFSKTVSENLTLILFYGVSAIAILIFWYYFLILDDLIDYVHYRMIFKYPVYIR